MEIPIMAHFAELDSNNIVIRVLVVRNIDITDEHGNEQEQLGIAFLQRLFGGNWKQTSYNTNKNTHSEGGIPFRRNFAGKNYVYDPFRDAFIPPKPEDPNNPDRYVLNEKTCFWTDTLQKNISIKVTRL
jgi:hypothetical protein